MQTHNSSRTFWIIGLVLVIVGVGAYVAWALTSDTGNTTLPPPKSGDVTTEQVEVVLPMVAFPTHEQLTEGFISGMEELGYQEGEDVVYHRVEEPIAPNPEGMQEIRERIRSHMEDGVDLMVASANVDASLMREEAEDLGVDIPIVALDMIDPVEKGVVESFEVPGGNITGVAERRTDSVGRFLDHFTRIVPGIESMGVLTEGFMIPSKVAPATDFLQALREQTDEFGIELKEYAIDTTGEEQDTEAELVSTLGNVNEGEVDSWVHMPGHFVHDQQIYEHEMGLRTNIPVAMPATIEIDPETGEIAGLFAYGASFTEKGAQGAAMADKIFRGTEPSELPIEFPRKYDLIINKGVAEDIGIEIPEEVLELADEVVES